jgi:hypothetical protein
LQGGANSKSHAFGVFIGKGAFLKDLNMSSQVIPKDASLTRFGMVDINAHLGLQCSPSAATSKSARLERLVNLLCAGSSSTAGLSFSAFISVNSPALKRLAVPPGVVRLEVLKTRAPPQRCASYRLLWCKKLVEGKSVQLEMPVKGGGFKVEREQNVLAGVLLGLVYVENTTEAIRQLNQSAQTQSCNSPKTRPSLPRKLCSKAKLPGPDFCEVLEGSDLRSSGCPN